MNDDYFRGHLTHKYGIEVITPSKEDQELMRDIGDRDLSRGIILDEARAKFRPIIRSLVAKGCQAVIVACTEFGRLLQKEDTSVALIDTVSAHVEAAVERALH